MCEQLMVFMLNSSWTFSGCAGAWVLGHTLHLLSTYYTAQFQNMETSAGHS